MTCTCGSNSAKIAGMELGTTILGAVIGGIIGAVKKEDPLKFALYGGGVGLGITFICGARSRGGFLVGQLPQALPPTGQPGQLVYNTDPRRDPLLDPVSRRQLYPQWLLLHWQNGDATIIGQVQAALGVSPDGVVGPGTSAAIHAFQAHSGLPVTGVMDRMTMEALMPG
jgi:peptidoglycan hydrolase-like protein with peptidoglycan-binding domain